MKDGEVPSREGEELVDKKGEADAKRDDLTGCEGCLVDGSVTAKAEKVGGSDRVME